MDNPQQSVPWDPNLRRAAEAVEKVLPELAGEVQAAQDQVQRYLNENRFQNE